MITIIFPDFLERPKELTSFSFSIREYILAQDGLSAGTVTWASRRSLSNSLKFIKKDHCLSISGDLNDLFKKISNRNAEYTNMSSEEKLGEINNVIENILKVNGKWETIDYKNKTFDFLSDKFVTEYRNLIHCFRHGAEKAIKERKRFTEDQKDFLVNYGTTICEVLRKNK